MLEGTLPSQTCKPSPSNVCALLPLKTLNTQQWRLGEGGCIPVCLKHFEYMGWDVKNKWVGWAPFSVFRIPLFGVKQRILIQMNCVAQK